jgi:hypothetical protein
MGPMVEDDCVPEEWLVVKMSRLGSPGRLALVVSELTVQVIVRTLVCRTLRRLEGRMCRWWGRPTSVVNNACDFVSMRCLLEDVERVVVRR